VPIPFSAPESSPASAAARSAVTGVDDPASISYAVPPRAEGDPTEEARKRSLRLRPQ
jgi:hypothetical protein